MHKLSNKFAIGCLIQWYEIELVEEYLQSVRNSIKNIENEIGDYNIYYQKK